MGADPHGAPSTGHVTIAVAQTTPVRGDREANLEQHLQLVQEAAREGAQLVLFPELSLTGYELDLARELALKPGDPVALPLAESAAYHEVTILAGAPMMVEGRLHIGTLIFAPDGRERVYTKHHLGAFPPDVAGERGVPPPEATVFEPGTIDPLLMLGDEEAALAICADIGHPEHWRSAAERGARFYLASMFLIPQFLEPELRWLTSHAKEHGLAIAMANFGGPTGGLEAAGGSGIWSRSGECVVQLSGPGVGLAIAERLDGDWSGRTWTPRTD